MAKEPEAHGEAPKHEAKAAPSSGGFKSWLPLLVTLLAMPALAYAMTTFVLLPKLQKSMGGGEDVHAREHDEATGSEGGEHGEHGQESKKGGGKEEGSTAKPKNKVALSKIVVNVSGSLGSRLLLASLTLAGNGNDFKSKIEDNTDQLRDLAASTLGSKTIADLEKPEARNLLRAELISQFNAALGSGTVQEIYITEFAIQ